MTVALAGRAPATFEIKSANLPLVSLLLKSADLLALRDELKARFGDLPEFFDQDPLVIDLSPLRAQGTAVDFDYLLPLLRSHQVVPVAVRGGNEAQMEAALKAGLAAAPDAVAAPARVEPEPETRRAEPARAQAQPVQAPAPIGALLIDRPLRSGQQIYARGRDLVVMSMVNPGAEVIADGSIHVYAPLRGKAIAGARGDAEARILTLCLEPELLSIAGVYRTSDVPLPAEVRGKPTQVRLLGGADGKLVMDRLDGTAPASTRGKVGR
jgi:septum site-determining protein MinC